ncbi:MAG: lysophospholipid acyltransferase family protein [Clostridia bacterium]|nr:lysophospholipid acyltransferase family protein [Clostridia bacterium]
MFYSFAVGLLRVFLVLFSFIRVYGRENMPKEGGAFVCSNHISNFDPVAVGVAVPRRLTFMAKSELFEIPLFGRLINALGAFPIHRHKGDAAAIKATLKIAKAGGATLIFPEGKRVKRGERIAVRPSLIRLAIQAKVPIVPVATNGKYFPFTGLKVYIGKPIYYDKYYVNLPSPEEMQYLADELMDKIYSMIK